jgi:hypothetical protein
MPASVWILNLTVLGVVLEADLGRRKIGWFRVLRPLLTAIVIVPLFLDSVPTNGHNQALQAVAIGVGLLLGVAARLFVSVGYGPVKGRTGTRDRAVSRAGFGYAAFWTVTFGGRLLFIYATVRWLPVPSASFRRPPAQRGRADRRADLHGRRHGAGPQRAAGRPRAGGRAALHRPDGRVGHGREQHPVTGAASERTGGAKRPSERNW